MEKLSSKHRFFLATSFSAFFVFSVPFVIQGSLAPVTMEYYGINAAQQGLIVATQSVGGICTAIFLVLKGEKYNKTHTIALGLLIVCLASTVIGLSPILPIVHVFFGIGAMLTPVFVTYTVDASMPETFSRLFRILTIAAALAFILYFLSSKRVMPETPYINMESMKKRVPEDSAEIFKTGTAWYFMVVAFLYFTFQLGANMWLPTYAIRNAGVDFNTGGMMLTAQPLRLRSAQWRRAWRLCLSWCGWVAYRPIPVSRLL